MDEIARTLRWHHEEQDARENAQSTPPESERIQLRSLWVVEFYPPSLRRSLLQGLEQLGWATELDTFLRQSPTRWIESARARPSGGGWMSIGVVVPPRRSGWPGTRQTDLPWGISHAFVFVHQLLPSHSAVVVQFVFEEAEAMCLDKALRQQHLTKYRTLVSGNGIFESPENQKRANLQRVRKRVLADCANWFRKHLPGSFASGSLNGEFPACEFVTLRERRPFTSIEGQYGSFLWILGMESQIDAWESEDLPGLYLSTDDSFWENNFHLVLAAREDDLLAGADLERYGGRNRGGFTNRLRDLHPWFARWALAVQLTSYEQQLAELRDRAPNRAVTGVAAAEQIQSVARSLIELRRDIAPFLTDLNALVENSQYFVDRTFEFCALEPDFRGRDNLLELIRRDLARRATAVRAQQIELADALLTESNVLAATVQIQLAETNRTLQRAMTGLTILIALLTIALLFRR